MATKVSGRCMCGAVVFEAELLRETVDACHCVQCRRWSGHFWASVNARRDAVAFQRGENRIGWYRTSEHVRRGFCRDCGSALFWQPDRHPKYSHIFSISAGSLDMPTGMKLTEHIFVGEKGDYYDLSDGLPQKESQ